MSRADPACRSEAGFTLIEMMVALAIFSLAALALLRLDGAVVGNAARLHGQALAQIAARNIAVETLTDPEPPALGRNDGVAANGGRAWRWTRETLASPEPRILMIAIAVRAEDDGTRASLTVFRRAGR